MQTASPPLWQKKRLARPVFQGEETALVIVDAEGHTVAGPIRGIEREVDADHIVACVNACAGISPESLSEGSYQHLLHVATHVAHELSWMHLQAQPELAANLKYLASTLSAALSHE